MKKFQSKTAEKKWQNRFPHYKSMCFFFSDAQGQLTPQSVVGSGRTSNSSKLSCMSSLPVSINKIRSKTAEKKWQHQFSHYNPMGATSCHGNKTFYAIWPKTICSLSHTQMMLQIKFDCDPSAGLRDIDV